MGNDEWGEWIQLLIQTNFNPLLFFSAIISKFKSYYAIYLI